MKWCIVFHAIDSLNRRPHGADGGSGCTCPVRSVQQESHYRSCCRWLCTELQFIGSTSRFCITDSRFVPHLVLCSSRLLKTNPLHPTTGGYPSAAKIEV